MPQASFAAAVTSGNGGERVVSLTGDLDISSSPVLDDLLQDLSEPVTIDMTGLSFIDSSGLSALLRSHDRASAAGSQLSLIVGSGPVRRLLEVTGLDSHFYTEHTESDLEERSEGVIGWPSTEDLPI